MAKEINNIFNIKNCDVLENFIDFKKFEMCSLSKTELRQFYNIPKDAFVIGNTSRFVESKNHFFLLDLFSLFLNANNKSILVLIGDDSYFKKEIEKRIKQKGLENNILIFQNRNDVNCILKTMDLFIFPSLYEGFSLSLLESQAANIQTIYSDCLSPQHKIRNNTLCLPLDIGVEGWYKQITKNHRNKHYLQNYKKYDVKSVINKISDIYKVT